MPPADCVFCKIVAGQIPVIKVWEDASTLAFLDIGPLAPGHTLLIPRAHYNRMMDVPEEVVAAVAAHLPRLTRAIMKATGAAGINILQNNGRVSGQVVEHVHFHLIPRAADDGLGFRWNAGTYSPGQAEAIQSRLQAELA